MGSAMSSVQVDPVRRDPCPSRRFIALRRRIELTICQLIERYDGKQRRARDERHLGHRLLRKPSSHDVAAWFGLQEDHPAPPGRPPGGVTRTSFDLSLTGKAVAQARCLDTPASKDRTQGLHGIIRAIGEDVRGGADLIWPPRPDQ